MLNNGSQRAVLHVHTPVNAPLDSSKVHSVALFQQIPSQKLSATLTSAIRLASQHNPGRKEYNGRHQQQWQLILYYLELTD